MSARGIRNNNPGNIVWTGHALFPGELGVEEGEHHVFARFDTAENGIKAIWLNLQSYQARHGLKTIDGMIRRWSTTDQHVYVASVARAVGVGPHDDVDVQNPLVARRMVLAIIQQENGEQPYAIALIDNALGVGPEPPQDTQPAAPIEDRSEPYIGPALGGADNSNAVTNGAPAMPIAIPLLAQLIPQVLQLFSARAQSAIAQKTGADPTVAGQFMQSVIQRVGEAVQVPVKDDASAIQAVAELTRQVEQQKADIKALEDRVQDDLHQLTEAATAMVDVRKQEVTIDTQAADAAAVRNDSAQVRRYFARMVWRALAVGAVAMLVIAETQIIYSPSHQADGQIIGALILAFGALVSAIALMGNYGYGSSGSSGAKDLLIGEMARRQPQGGK